MVNTYSSIGGAIRNGDRKHRTVCQQHLRLSFELWGHNQRIIEKTAAVCLIS